MRWLLASRRRVLFTALLALAALDVARSIQARMVYAGPLAVWEADGYARMAWPPGAGVPAGAGLGARVFAQRCAVCHGLEGRGNGPAAPSLSPRPRDFTLGEFHYKSTGAGEPASDEDLLRTVRDGLHASAMPYFRDLLGDAELSAVVAHVRSLGPARAPGTPLTVSPRVPADAASVARGRELYEKGCTQCHGADLRGGLPYRDEHEHRVLARDLTAPWTFRGGAEPRQIWLRLTTGLGPMPEATSWTTPQERWDIVNYVLARPRKPPWEAGGRLDGPGHDPDLVRRGDYLAHFEMCALCHTQIDRTGIYREDGWGLAGGMRVQAWPHPTFLSRNLTSDVDTGIGGQSPEQIAETIRNGRRTDRTLDPWGMPWWMLHAFDAQDALALGSYFKSTEPVRNFVPPPVAYGVVETLIGKLASPLPAAMPRRLTYTDGNFGGGEADAGRNRELPQRILVDAQWAVLILMIVGVLFAPGRQERRPWRTAALVVGVAVLAGLVWIVLELPQIIPAEPLARAIAQDLPKPDLSRLPPHQAALVQRGRYLYAVASCMFCHGSRGEGGNKISWKPFGSLWTRNITSDPQAGIGAWTEEEIARAIRSGISRDGRQLHWQGMTWDLLSNLDEEDLRSIIAYVRLLPPVKRPVPAAAPPAANDCAIYTFYLRGDMSRPGCD